MNDTVDHINKVREKLDGVIGNLRERALVHDASKLEEPELSGYAGLAEAVKGLQYGIQEYRDALKLYKPIIAHHYAHNSHHPEYWNDGVFDMSLLDIIEMLCDWKAASERSNGDFSNSLKVSIERFNIHEQTADILRNTAIELGWINK